jgi:hypothetical protein
LIRIVVGGGGGGGSSKVKKSDNGSGWTKPTDLLPLFFNFTMDTSTDFLFGEEVGALAAVERGMKQSQSETDADADAANSNCEDKDNGGYGAVAASAEFSEALRIASDGLVLRLRLQNMYWLGDGFAFRKATRRVWEFVDGFVERALAKVEAEGKGEGVTRKEDGGGGGDEREKMGSSKKFGLLESLLEQTRDREDLIAQTLGKIASSRKNT